MWRDDLFTSFGQMLGATLAEPYAEKAVAVYERSDMPNYFKVEKLYTADYVSQIYAGDDSYMTQLADYCPGADLYINATNPDKVYVETQFGFYDPFLMMAWTCKHANRISSTAALHCAKLREKSAKWDFCVQQYFCRATGRYEIKPEAAQCKMRGE